MILSGTVTLLIHFYLLNVCTFLFLCVVWYDCRVKMFCSSWLFVWREFVFILCHLYFTRTLMCQPWFPYQMNIVSLTVTKRMPLVAHELLILSGHLWLLLNLVFCVCGTWYFCTFLAILLSVRLITPVAFSNCLALRWTYDDKRIRGTLKQTTWQRMVENEMMKRKNVKGDWKEDKNKKLWKRLVIALCADRHGVNESVNIEWTSLQLVYFDRIRFRNHSSKKWDQNNFHGIDYRTLKFYSYLKFVRRFNIIERRFDSCHCHWQWNRHEFQK